LSEPGLAGAGVTNSRSRARGKGEIKPEAGSHAQPAPLWTEVSRGTGRCQGQGTVTIPAPAAVAEPRAAAVSDGVAAQLALLAAAGSWSRISGPAADSQRRQSGWCCQEWPHLAAGGYGLGSRWRLRSRIPLEVTV